MCGSIKNVHTTLKIRFSGWKGYYQYFKYYVTLQRSIITSKNFKKKKRSKEKEKMQESFLENTFGAFFLTHFQPMFSFYSPWKHHKTKGFLVISGCVKWVKYPKNVGGRILFYQYWYRPKLRLLNTCDTLYYLVPLA